MRAITGGGAARDGLAGTLGAGLGGRFDVAAGCAAIAAGAGVEGGGEGMAGSGANCTVN